MPSPDRTSLWLDRPLVPVGDPLPADGGLDTLVVGGGLTGLVTALLLVRAGQRVGVVEARSVGAVTTGRTTAKVSLLQGTKLSRVCAVRSPGTAAAYVEANRVGMEWLLRFCGDHGVAVQRRDAVTYAADRDEVSQVRREHEAAIAAGLPVRWADRLDLPFPAYGATILADQAQLHPMDLVDALVREIRRHGGTVHEGMRVIEIGRERVGLEDGTELRASQVVLATGTPILDRGLHFAQLEPKRSYPLAFGGLRETVPMCLSAGASARSVRDAPLDRPYLLVGGSGHPVGRARSESAHLDELRGWVRDVFPGLVETHAWSAQDYSPYHEVPIVGRLPLSGRRVYVATGFDKWGMTNAPAAAHVITAEILGGRSPGLPHHWLAPRSALRLARLNACVAVEMARGVLPAHRCTHLGGPLHWNDAERSWDCPLHGSRFDEDGSVLEGPATRRLPDLDPEWRVGGEIRVPARSLPTAAHGTSPAG